MNEGHVGMTYMSSGNRMAALMKAAPGDIKAQQQVCPSLFIIPLGRPPVLEGGLQLYSCELLQTGDLFWWSVSPALCSSDSWPTTVKMTSVWLPRSKFVVS